MKRPLYRLPSGRHLDLSLVIDIKPLDGEYYSPTGDVILPRVVLRTRDNRYEVVDCEPGVSPTEKADELAALVNAAREDWFNRAELRP